MAKTNDRETEEAVKNLEAVLNNDPDLPSPSPDSFGQNIQTTRGGEGSLVPEASDGAR